MEPLKVCFNQLQSLEFQPFKRKSQAVFEYLIRRPGTQPVQCFLLSFIAGSLATRSSSCRFTFAGSMAA